MLLHIGNDVGIPLEKLICVLNAKGMSEESKRVVDKIRRDRTGYYACGGKPRAFLLVRGNGKRVLVYESPIAPATLEKRWKSACLHEQIEALAVLSVTAAVD